jgi:hypothetical protein
MKFYTIHQDCSYSDWVAMLPWEQEKQLKLKENIKYEAFWQFPEMIPFWMLSRGLMKSTIKYADVHEWKHDAGMAPPPSAKFLVISQKIRHLFQKLSLPEHRYYKAILRNRYNDSDEERYYDVLHIRNDHYEKLYYPAVEFCLSDDVMYNPQKQIPKYAPGVISNYQEYLEKSREAQEINMFLKPTSYIYTDTWDVLWGHGREIIVHEQAKDLLLAEGVQGVSFETYYGPDIVMGHKG